MSTHGAKYSIYLAERIQSGQFSFRAYQSEEYLICFLDTSDDHQVILSIDFEWRTGVMTLGRRNIPKKSDIDVSFLNFQYKFNI